MSESTMTQVRIVPETGAYGTPDAVAATNINVSTVQIKESPTMQNPNMLRGDLRRYSDEELENIGSVELATKLQFGNTTLLQQGFLLNEYETVTVTGTTISFNNAGVISDSGNGLGSFLVGDLVYVSGSDDNDGWHGYVTAKAAGSLTVQTPTVTEAAGASITVQTTRCRDAADFTLNAFSAEWQDTDLDKFLNSSGLRVVDQGLKWASGGSYAEETYTLSGKVPQEALATLGTGAPTAAPTGSFLNAVGDFSNLRFGAEASALIISSFDLKNQRNNGPIRGVGRGVGPADIRLGDMTNTLTLDYYWGDDAGSAFYTLNKARGTTSAWWTTPNSAGDYAFALPALKFGEAQIEVGEVNKRKMGHGVLTAYAHPTWNYQYGIYKRTA